MLLPVVYYFLLILAMLGCLVVVLLGLPGVWLLLLSVTLYGWATHWNYIGWHGLAALLILAILSEVLEFFAAGVAAKQAGGGERASIGAIVGAFVGGLVSTFVVPVPVLGTLAGLCAGAFAGALILEQSRDRRPLHLLRVGFSAARGRLLGTLLKIALALAMFLVALALALPLHPMRPAQIVPNSTAAKSIK